MNLCGHDEAFTNITLPAPWKVKHVMLTAFTAGVLNVPGTSVSIVDKHEGTDNAQVGLDYCALASMTMGWKVGVLVEGPDGTTPW